jgi:hypothetical protein
MLLLSFCELDIGDEIRILGMMEVFVEVLQGWLFMVWYGKRRYHLCKYNMSQ